MGKKNKYHIDITKRFSIFMPIEIYEILPNNNNISVSFDEYWPNYFMLENIKVLFCHTKWQNFLHVGIESCKFKKPKIDIMFFSNGYVTSLTSNFVEDSIDYEKYSTELKKLPQVFVALEIPVIVEPSEKAFNKLRENTVKCLDREYWRYVSQKVFFIEDDENNYDSTVFTEYSFKFDYNKIFIRATPLSDKEQFIIQLTEAGKSEEEIETIIAQCNFPLFKTMPDGTKRVKSPLKKGFFKLFLND